MPAPMVRPERELRKDYEATQQMQVGQLQTEYADRGFTILRAGTDLENVRRNIWAAYDPKTGDTYVFSGTRETSFGTSQSVLDAVGRWVDKRNADLAFSETMDDTQRQIDLRGSRESVRSMDARMQAYFTEGTQQPAQVARETPAQPAARAAEPVREERAPATEQAAPSTAEPVAREAQPAAASRQQQALADAIRTGQRMRIPVSQSGSERVIITIDASQLSESDRSFQANRAERGIINTPVGIIGLYRLSRENPGAISFTYPDGTQVSEDDLRTRGWLPPRA
ncbi:MAG: hypothetical protein PHQ80_01220 [Candidatus ainarchaeum sp.]|nr:hypothetical protein [Candidatus ainarchaeum sp.]MDD5095947.1 hypothetical protein [Candidatus ainarchaeum sp.]